MDRHGREEGLLVGLSDVFNPIFTPSISDHKVNGRIRNTSTDYMRLLVIGYFDEKSDDPIQRSLV